MSLSDILRGNILVLTVGDVIRSLSLFVTFPYFSLYIRALGGSAVDIGVVNSLRFVIAFFIYPVAGYLADTVGRVKIIGLTGYVSVVLYMVFMLAPDWRMLALGNLLLGVTAFIFPAMNALMADSIPPEQRGIGYSIWRLFPSAVGVLSPYIGGYLISLYGVVKAMRLLYGLTACTAALIATMNLRLLRETYTRREEERTGGGFLGIIIESYRDVFQMLGMLSNRMKAFTLMLIISIFFNSCTAPYWVIYAVETIGLSELQWGIILLMVTGLSVVLLLPAGYIVDRFGAEKMLIISMTLSSIPVILFPYSKGFTDVIVLLLILTLFNAFLISGAPAYMAHSAPRDRRGRVMAALGQGMLFINIRGGSGGPGMGALLTIPSIIGSVTGGIIYNYNNALPWLLLTISLIFNSILAIIFLSLKKN